MSNNIDVDPKESDYCCRVCAFLFLRKYSQGVEKFFNGCEVGQASWRVRRTRN